MVTVLNLTKYNLTSNLKAIYGEDCEVIDYLNDSKTLDDLDWGKSVQTASLTIGRCTGYWLGMTEHKLDYVIMDVPKDERKNVNKSIMKVFKMMPECKTRCLFVNVSFSEFLNMVSPSPENSTAFCESEEDKTEE